MSDLAECEAKILFANALIDQLDIDLRSFEAMKPFDLVKSPWEGKGDLYRFKINQNPPMLIQVAAGTILHLQRSSLDNLAIVLAARNGHKDSRKTYFPVCRDVKTFASSEASKKYNELSAADQKKIQEIKPYSGGNDLLYALHDMNLTDKHRNLCTVGISIDHSNPFRGSGVVRQHGTYPPKDGDSYKDGDPYAFLDADGEIELGVIMTMTFNQPGFQNVGSIELLRRFSGECERIINIFR